MPDTSNPQADQDLPELSRHGHGLTRPECVLAHRSGYLFAADWAGRGGVSITDPAGNTRIIEAINIDFDLRPNGIALTAGGEFLIAHLGPEQGGVYRLSGDGRVEPVLLEIDGVPLPPTNFVHADAGGGLWISVSTRKVPRALAYRSDVADGFLIRLDQWGARIVADTLGYTNECVPTPDGARLYVNETFARRLSVFDIRPDGSLTGRRILTEFSDGTFPDGLAFDKEGHAWITSIVSNRVIRVAPDGGQQVILEDNEPEHLAFVEAAYRAHAMGRPHLDTIRSRTLRNISSLAFGGDDLRTAYLGCLLGSEVRAFRTAVPGHPPPHWNIDLTPLLGVQALRRHATPNPPETRLEP